ncbi:NADH dehydrogenase [ubiquinone] 1 alpha subcomplex subunit 9, mitochondrial-like [Physella acuta]|uniref:NADH dehydrogenase [ubiquinone] 1 alpha subcomplex subunit 9, mitochondrial-like n=1 Tax=Physella acuta TaxID=109671 RepID=UPI0027DCF538|nr:NADH dehydrogenase [ubiquinone] 1 alpha subcomplex subunit 9, mitochondrial-like [Physella acuta]
MASVLVAKATASSLGRKSMSGQTWYQVPRAVGCIIIQQRDASTNVPTKLSSMKRGTGGRSSFSGIVATVFGASGYLGKYVCNKLGKIGSQIIIPYRGDQTYIERLRLTGDLGQVLFFPFELRDEESIRKTVQYSNVVINLVGRQYETRNYNFHDVHVAGARRLAKISKECGVEKFIHISHLNAKAEPQKVWETSRILKTKYESELAVREEFPEAIIFKPSDMFGAEDNFLNYYTNRLRWSWYGRFSLFSDHIRGIPLWQRGERTIKQPVFVSDVAEGIIKAIQNPDMVGQTIQCVGPQRYYLADIVDFIINVVRREDVLVRSGYMFVPRLRAKLYNSLPMGRWYNTEKLEMEALTDWTVPGNLTLEDLGVTLTQFDDMARFFLKSKRRFAYYQEELGEFDEAPSPKPAEFYQDKSLQIR